MPELDPRDARIAALEAKVAWLVERVAKLEAENADLRAELARTSRNSSQPPSPDLPGTPRQPKDPTGTPRQPKDPTGRARGGQPGHKQHKRERLEPDEVIVLIPARCDRCSRKLRGRDPSPRVHQVIDLPEVRPHVTDYELHELAARAARVPALSCPWVCLRAPSGRGSPLRSRSSRAGTACRNGR